MKSTLYSSKAEKLINGYPDRLISYVEEWAPPQPPKRRCHCGVILRMSNTADDCEVCKRKNKQLLPTVEHEGKRRYPNMGGL